MKSVVFAIISLAVLSVSARPFSFRFISESFSFKPAVHEVVFTPAKLPCAFSIKDHTEVYHESKMVDTFNQTLFQDGHVIALYDYNYGQEPIIATFRYDLSYEYKGFTVIPFNHAEKSSLEPSCVSYAVPKEMLDEQIADMLRRFTDEQSFDSVEKSTFKGRKCNKYYRKDEELEVMFFTDDNNYLIGMVERDNLNNTLIAELEYNFNVPMSAFAVDKNSYPGCDDEAYTVPEDQCK